MNIFPVGKVSLQKYTNWCVTARFRSKYNWKTFYIFRVHQRKCKHTFYRIEAFTVQKYISHFNSSICLLTTDGAVAADDTTSLSSMASTTDTAGGATLAAGRKSPDTISAISSSKYCRRNHPVIHSQSSLAAGKLCVTRENFISILLRPPWICTNTANVFILIAGSSHDLVTLPGDSDIESRSRSMQQGSLSGLNPPSVNTSRPPSESDSSKFVLHLSWSFYN